MDIKNDIAEYFFSLVYPETYSEFHIENISEDEKSFLEEFPKANILPLEDKNTTELFAIILSCNNRNKNIFLNMPFFENLLKKLGLQSNQRDIQALQIQVLEYIQKQDNINIIYEIFEHLSTLKVGGIILYEEEQCIKTSFKHYIHQLTSKQKLKKIPKRQKPKAFNVKNSWFYQNISHIEEILEDAKKLSFMPIWLAKFADIQINNLKQAKFHISICGIAKSGKSTLLNALLSQDVLEISAIPESTNKIKVSYAKEPKGIVKFLNKKEWKKFIENLYFDDELNTLMKENKESFRNLTDLYITDDGLELDMKTDDIKNYTSSKHYSKISYLVKEIIIQSPVELLKNNLTLINTPNINTIFNYKAHQIETCISKSIAVLYLINASKPHSQKDIDFLSNIIAYENLEKVLIVFTRSDLVSLPDLKNLSSSIIDDIKKTSSGNINKNISKIDFIPIASTLALLHRTNHQDDALLRGYDIEDTGIIALEDYIENIIFKHPTQYTQKLLLNTYTNLEKIFKKSLSILEQSNTQKNIIDLDEKLSDIKNKILDFAQEMLQTVESTTEGTKIKIKNLGLNLKGYLLDYINYESSKNNYINASKLENIITTNLKDNLRYLIEKTQSHFDKRLETFIENIHLVYSLINPDKFETELLRFYENNLREITKYQYTEGDLNLYTNELKKYINHILRDGAKLRDIKKTMDMAFELSYENILTYLDQKIDRKKKNFLDKISQMIESMEFVIKNNSKPFISPNPKEKISQLQEIKNIEEKISSYIKELRLIQ
ncbi:dynamin family protein [Helicobacter cappadocius]|uniref:Dynamin family protein n=1 Tax=Helicobacter cappadocius TaxID=3063998 RepID=A0AA90PT45_9HELI|nr:MULTISPECIES: dynamin family protein [unclassified Helicobacter]MDO7253032.1 dynamin family protein [Helicobacter sp. faydin-H75]MDP2538979.1 dynamin family protein [Helicobacter sp. faydin-H76]